MSIPTPVRPLVSKPAAAPAQPRSSGRMKLANGTSGRLSRPRRIVLYGTEGVGKSTFAACAPSPAFIGAEDGTAELDVKRYPEPETWSEVIEAIDDLATSEHDRRTVVIDTLDWLEPLCWSHVCAKASKASIEDFGYGRGYEAALDEWRILLARLNALRDARGMSVVLLAHSWIKTFQNPEGDDFDRYELKLHKKAAGLIKEWSDAVLFARYEEFSVGGDGKGGKGKGAGVGARLLHTERRPAWDAKNRYGLPESLPLSWDEFDAACKAGTPDDPAKLVAAIEDVAGRSDDKTAMEIRAAVGRAGGDVTKLAALLDWARGKAAKAAEKGDA